MVYEGQVVRESLTDTNLLDSLHEVTRDFDSEIHWTTLKVKANKQQIIQLSKFLKEKFYFHFWCGDNVIVAYNDKIFEFKYSDKDSWQPAVEHGLSIGIPIEQLDFPIE